MKKYYALCLFLILFVSMWAVDANDFLIGAYSQYQIRYAGSNYDANFDSLGVYLNNAGYNATIYSLTSGFEHRLSTILQKLHESDIKSMLHDNTWSPSVGRLGVGSTTFGNRLQIEAEYQLKTEVVNGNTIFVVDDLSTYNQTLCMESYDYVTKHEVGISIEEPPNYEFSNDNVWLCDSSQGHTAGKALSYPRKRWKPSWSSWPSLLSKDIVFYSAAINDNKLYVSVALQYENISNGTPVADISLKLYNPPDPDIYSEYELTNPSHYVNIPLTPTNPIYSTNIVAQTYPTSIQDEFGNYFFEYYVDLSTLKPYMTGSINSATREFYHISPEVYWHGNGKLIVDYITIEDDINRSVRSDPSSSYFAQINSQISTLSGYDPNNNLLFLMSMDEPRAGQLQMYKHMQYHLNSINPPRKMVTAMWLKDYGITKHDGTSYNYHKRFLHETNPDRIMVDVYPLQGNIVWNGSNPSVQSKIDNMLHYYYYKLVKNVQQSNNPDTEILHIPQTFGIVREDTGSWSYNMPPRSMVKAMNFLPLCYASDGIVDFCIASNPTSIVEGGNWVTPLIHETGDWNYDNLGIPDHMSAYAYLADANHKIAKYGTIVKGLTWMNANKIMTTGISTTPALNHEDSILLNSVYLNSINVDAAIDSTGYTGHVQCGYYSDEGNPYFMLVNRRAVYQKSNISSIPLKHVDLRFNDADPQSVCFEPSTNSHTIFGTHIAMYDPYDSAIYKEVNGEVSVEIGPGDGKLLQMCSTLPASVNSDATLKTLAHIAGSVTIDDSSFVNILPGTETWIQKNSVITVKGGSRLKMNGTVCIGDSVQIIAEEGGILEIDASTCEWGREARIVVNGASFIMERGSLNFGENCSINATNSSTIIIDSVNCSIGSGSIMDCSGSSLYIVDSTIGTPIGVVWDGIRAEQGTVVLDNSIISNAESNRMSDVSLISENCIFNVPENSLGLYLSCYSSNNSSVISANQEGKGFFGVGENNFGIGIDHSSSYSGNTLVKNIEFHNLSWGFTNWTTAAISDTIKDCTFVECQIGIDLQGSSYNPWILASDFISCQKGILLEATSPKIHDCDFESCQVGIFTESTISPDGEIKRCEFTDSGNNYTLPIGIESRGSNIRVANNDFYGIHTAILCHAGSNLNLSNNAKNKLMADNYNIKFLDDSIDYKSTIQVYTGHNDFYHVDPNLTRTNDYSFDQNYYVVEPPKSRAFDGSYNWYKNSVARIECPSEFCNRYVKVLYYDPAPNVPIFPEEDRMAVALGFENENQHENAKLLFKAILDEDLEAESKFILNAIDGFYRTSHKLETPSEVVETYLQSKIVQYEAVDYHVVSFLKDYLVKQYLSKKDFQSAIDLIQARLDNPSSPIDSLLAVLDLEIVFMLYDMEDSKAPVRTKYAQYKYPTKAVYRTKHNEHWDLLKELSGQGTTPEIPIPPVATISRNYPNPFNPSTTIEYSIPAASNVRLNIYNIKGQRVAELVNADLQRGHHKVVWNGKDSQNRNVSTGIYLIRMEANGKSATHKTMLMK